MRRSALDVARLRADFPILEREINGYPLAYLDSASSTQKPRAVIDSLVDTYSSSYANVHRGVYSLAEETTERYEGAREKVRAFLGAALFGVERHDAPRHEVIGGEDVFCGSREAASGEDGCR